MILAQYLPNVGSQANHPIQKAFGILPFKYILPHFDKMSARWAAFLESARLELLPGEKIIGIDDETAFVGKRGGEWRVMGQRRVHIITREKTEEYPVGETLAFE